MCMENDMLDLNFHILGGKIFCKKHRKHSKINSNRYKINSKLCESLCQPGLALRNYSLL